jgi:hypothetical protein
LVRLYPDRAANLNEFHYLQATLAPLVFGDKRLMTAQSLGQLMLGEPGRFAGQYELTQEFAMLRSP